MCETSAILLATPGSGTKKEDVGMRVRSVNASVAVLMLGAMLAAGCAKHDDSAAKAEQAAARSEDAARRAEAAAGRVEAAAQRAEAAAEKAERMFSKGLRK